MVGLLLGVVLLAFTIVALLPGCLGWSSAVVAFLKGCIPVIAGCAGCIALLVGIADIKDKAEARKDEHVLPDSKNE